MYTLRALEEVGLNVSLVLGFHSGLCGLSIHQNEEKRAQAKKGDVRQ